MRSLPSWRATPSRWAATKAQAQTRTRSLMAALSTSTTTRCLCPRGEYGPRRGPFAGRFSLGRSGARFPWSDARVRGLFVAAGGSATSAASSSRGAGFSELGLDSDLVRRLRDLGVVDPTPIQRESVSALVNRSARKDLDEQSETKGLDSTSAYAIEAYTGSGKTLAYLLPIVNDLLREKDEEGAKGKKGIYALVVVPSQELAMQIYRVAQLVLGEENKRMVAQCIGGANKKRQVAALKANSPRIVVGTPGRLADLSKAGQLHTHFVTTLVLDEADKLLQDNYSKDLEMLQMHIGKKNPGHYRVLCSATMSKSTASLFTRRGWIPSQYSHLTHTRGGKKGAEEAKDEVDVQSDFDTFVLGADGGSGMQEPPLPELSPNLDHCFVPTQKNRKADTVRRCINALKPTKVLVFHNFSNQLSQTAAKLSTGEITTGILDGKMKKEQKRKIIQQFTRGDIRALVASEAATRGLDFPGCDCVVNMDMPMDLSHYIHRAGRTGRGNTRGVVISVPSGKEVHVVTKYAKKLKIEMPEYQVANGKLVPSQ